MTDEAGPDWAAIRLAVEAGGATLEAIAAEHGLQRSAISMRKFRGGWLGPADIRKLMRVEADIEKLIGGALKQMRAQGAPLDELAARTRALSHEICDAAELKARLELVEQADRRLAARLKMIVDFTRLQAFHRRAAADIRKAESAREMQLERPDFAALERAILDRFETACAAGLVEDADAGGEGAAEAVLGVLRP